MESLFHLIFTVIKVAIQASIYALVVKYIIVKIAEVRPHHQGLIHFAKLKGLWWILGAGISFLLYFWLFSYWGYHGFGDYARVPIGHGLCIEQINSYYTYSQDLELEEITSFAINDQFLVGEVTSQIKPYFVCNLESQEITYYSAQEYKLIVQRLKLPVIFDFKDFHEHYRDYWSVWKFIFLP